MAKNLTLRGTIELSTKQWNKAINMVKSSLRSLKMSVMGFAASIGAGMGISELAKSLVESAKKMDQAQTTLKNVSGTEYANNQKFLIELAEKYNQEIITLTGNFSKFHASSNEANVSLADQKKIFESLTRASAYFNLSADESNSVFLAVTQMMSKGKVSAEELRRQLGERLPGAFGLMAKAAGMTTAELDKALREGKLMSSEVLPKFADELNKVTHSLDVDTIQGWTNKLKTSIVGLSQKLKIGDIYKNVVKFGAKSISWITKNIRSVWGMLGGLAVSIPTTIFTKYSLAQQKYYDGLQEQLNSLQLQSKRKLASATSTVFNDTKGKAYVKGYLGDKEWKAGMPAPDNFRLINENLITSKTKLKDVKKLIREINNNYTTQAELIDKLNGRMTLLQRIGKNIKTMVSSFVPAVLFNAIIAGLGAIIGKMTEIFTRVKRARKEIQKLSEEWELFKQQEPVEASLLKAYAKEYEEIMSKENPDQKKGEVVLSAINSLLKDIGKEEIKYGESTSEVNKRIQETVDLLCKQRNVQEAISKLNEAQNKLPELEKKKVEAYKKYISALKTYNTAVDAGGYDGAGALALVVKDKKSQFDAIMVQINAANADIEKYSKYIAENREATDLLNTDEFKDIDLIIENFKKDVAKLKTKLQDGAITQEEYNDAFRDLAKGALNALYSIENIPDSAKKTYDEFKRYLIGIIRSGKGKGKGNPMDDYYEKKKKLDNQLASEAITREEWEKKMKDLTKETDLALGAMGKLTGSLKKFSDKIDRDMVNIKWEDEDTETLKQEETDIADREKEWNDKYSAIRDLIKKMPKEKEDKDLFAFTKTETERLEDKLENKKEYVEQLKSLIESVKGDPKLLDYMDELEALLAKAVSEADNLQDATDLSKAQELIKGYKKELMTGTIDGINAVANGMERIRSGIESLNNPDITGFERMLMIINMVIQATETLLQTMELFEAITGIIDKLAGAEAALGAVSDANSKKAVAGAMTEVSANAAKGASSAGAEAAKLPFPANIAAIGAAIAAAAALFASIPKFEKGGIVGGNSPSGDKILARLNSGEMVLNKAQQNALLNGSGANVQFKIKGSDLIGVMNNYQKKITK